MKPSVWRSAHDLPQGGAGEKEGCSVTFGSAFAGVGGFDLGLERAGLVCRFQIEIDAFCRRVLARHWPHVARHEDIRFVSERELVPVDVLCGGFPCQDLSIAGKRKGLKGERSGLFYQFTRIAAELRPTWVLLENVDGLLSSHLGADFGHVLRELEDVGYVAGAWRVLDSRWFGVPQRRNRVFIVGCLGASGRRPETVLFESARRSWDSPPRREARARIARGTSDGVAFSLRQDPGGIGQGHNTNFVTETAATLRGRSHGPGTNAPGRGGEDDVNLVLAQNGSDIQVGHQFGTLAASQARQTSGDLIFGPLGGGDNGVGRRNEDDPNLVYDTTQITSKTNRSNPKPGAPCHPLAATAHAPLLAHALTSSRTRTGRLDPNGETFIAGALGGNKDMGGWRCGPDEVAANQAVAESRGVRRLTPLEGERLQGLPDGWTCLCGVQPYSTRACVCKDGPRYKALGNAVTVPVIEWIGRRLMAAEMAQREEAVS
jgi:DNA (cytosine-5)-methyltransferase 1